METMDPTIYGIGEGHKAWLRLYRAKFRTLDMAKDSSERPKLSAWERYAAEMAEVSKSVLPSDVDHEYWALIAMHLEMAKKVAKENPHWIQVSRKSLGKRCDA